MVHDASWDFDEIRPYNNSEIQGVLKRLTKKHSFFLLTRFLFPTVPAEELAQQLTQVSDVDTLQAKFISGAIQGIIDTTCTSLTTEGIDQLSSEVPYLIISNHRDIILDPAFLQVCLFKQKIPTTRLAIGDNLLISSLISDLMRINKSFIVHREVPRNNLFAFSLRLSRYIRQSISAEKSSVWIAQRNGRTKDGNDCTQTALLKMLAISDEGDFATSMNALNFRTMAISYEYEPCDQLKAEELYHIRAGLTYTKDDKQAMINGIREPKGRVHLAIGPDMKVEISAAVSTIENRTLQVKALTQLIDRYIHLTYKLWPTNYIAADLLTGNSHYSGKYSAEEKLAFENHLANRLDTVKGDPQAIYQLMLAAYAKPVENQLAAKG